MKIEKFRELLEEKLKVLESKLTDVHVKLLNYPRDDDGEEVYHDLSASFKNYLYWAKDYTRKLINLSQDNYNFIVERNCEPVDSEVISLGCDSLDLLDDIYRNILFIEIQNSSILRKLEGPITESLNEDEKETEDFKETLNMFMDKIIYELDTTIEIVEEQYDFIVFEPKEETL